MTELMIMLTGSLLMRILFSAGLFLAGLALLARLDPSPKPMGRFMFGVIYLFSVGMAGAGTQLWLLIAAENPDVASWAFLLWTFAFLTLLAFGSRRRSLDGYGHTERAILAFIPLLNIILLFKSPVGERASGRTALAWGGRVVAFVAVAILAILPTSFLSVIGDTVSLPPALTRLSPDRAARVMALINEANAPIMVDSITMLTGASSAGRHVTLNYNVIGETAGAMTAQEFSAAMSDFLQSAACLDANTRYIIRNSGSITYAYRILGKTDAEDASFTVSVCP